MKEETNNIIQGLLFLSTKYPEGKVSGGGGNDGRYIEFILPNEYVYLELEDISYLESLGWDEYDNYKVDVQSHYYRLWRFYTEPLEQYEEEEEWEDI